MISVRMMRAVEEHNDPECKFVQLKHNSGVIIWMML